LSSQYPTIVRPLGPVTPDGISWQPQVGDETVSFLKSIDIPEESQKHLRDAAVSILSRGINPNDETCVATTGLVVGYVQSGKTMSFETVAALAHDNSFQVIIVIAGISTLLLDQSTNRLRRDLGLDDSRRPRRWIHFQNPSDKDGTPSNIRNALEDWRDPDTPAHYRKTVLITVLKNHHHLRNLVALFETLDMNGVPALIIDDEADQASLNTAVASGDESTTYRCLMALRERLPAQDRAGQRCRPAE